MTLLELLKQIRGIESRMLTTEGIPLKMFGKDCEVLLKLCGDNGNYWVEVRPSIGLNEQAAIIMQMFEDGNSDSIAALVADHIEKAVIEKACEVLSQMLYTKRDDEHHAQHYVRSAEAMGEFITQTEFLGKFKNAMEA